MCQVDCLCAPESLHPPDCTCFISANASCLFNTRSVHRWSIQQGVKKLYLTVLEKLSEEVAGISIRRIKLPIEAWKGEQSYPETHGIIYSTFGSFMLLTAKFWMCCCSCEMISVCKFSCPSWLGFWWDSCKEHHKIKQLVDCCKVHTCFHILLFALYPSVSCVLNTVPANFWQESPDISEQAVTHWMDCEEWCYFSVKNSWKILCDELFSPMSRTPMCNPS